jgi:hypothetical protein
MAVDRILIRLCLFRCFRPDRLKKEIEEFIAEFAGSVFVEHPPFRFELIA